MHIHIIGINYQPEQTGIAVFTTGRAEYLAARGHRVTMCTAPPYYPQWRVAKGYRRFWFGRDEQAGVTILRCPIYVPAVVTPLRRVLHEASFVLTAFLRSLFSPRPDAVLVVSPPLGLALVAVALSLIWRVPYVFDVQDLQPDAAVDLGMMQPGSVTRFLYAVERLAYRRAAVVSTLTDAMRARIIAKGVPAEKVHRHGLWADEELFALKPHADDREVRMALGLGRAFVVLHVGNMGVKQGLEVIIDAARHSRGRRARDVRYVLVGDGAVRRQLEARARALGLANLTILPLLPREAFLRLLATADVCLVTQQRTVADIVFPSKVLTLLAAGKPVIASVTAGSAVAHTLTAAGAGLVVEPENPKALYLAVESLKADEALRDDMAACGREYSRRHWRRNVTLDAFESMLMGLLTPRAQPAVPRAY